MIEHQTFSLSFIHMVSAYEPKGHFAYRLKICQNRSKIDSLKSVNSLAQLSSSNHWNEDEIVRRDEFELIDER